MINKLPSILIGSLILVTGFLITTPLLAQETAESPTYFTTINHDLAVPIGTTTKITSLSQYIRVVYEFGISILGVVATLMIVFGGFRWVIAAGNEAQIGKAKETITSAIIGLAIGLLSYLILYTINPAIVSLSNIGVPIIKPLQLTSLSSGCKWLETAADGETEVADQYCAASGDKPDTTYKCYCALGSAVVAAAQAHASAKDLCYSCCGGWVAAVYDSVLAAPQRFYSGTGNNVPAADIAPGDWVIYYNGNQFGGEHAAILLDWSMTTLTGTCISRTGGSSVVSTKTCDFSSGTLRQAFHPTPKTSYAPPYPGQTYCAGATSCAN